MIKQRKKSRGSSALPPAEIDEPEERRSSMAKVPNFIQQIRERTTEEKRGSMTKLPNYI